VARAFQLLQLVVAADEPLGVRELSRRSGMPKSAVGRMLANLDELGMVERTPDGAARPGAGLATLTRRVERTPAVLREQFRPLVADMEREFGENAAVGIDDAPGFLYLASSRASTAVQVADPVGEWYPPHLVAPGLVAMSGWTAERLDGYLADPLPAATPNSVTDPAAIRRRLGRARRDGYAWTDQELDLDVNGLAVPITDADGRQIAVATLYGPAYRLSAAEQPALGPALAEFVATRTVGAG
jgi:DNA-binding IclR family transcriptional regulator